MSTTAKISWVEGALLVAEGGSGHTLTMDGAPDVGGRNLASRPMEVVLMGMGGCTAIDVVSMLKKQRQDIEGIEVSLVEVHRLVETVHNQLRDIAVLEVKTQIKKRSVFIAVERYVSPGRTL